MKKSGILNAKLLYELAKLRHTDILVICDAGFPIPAGANTVDVSLVAGIPDFPQVLRAVLNEVIFESYTLFDFMESVNPEYKSKVEKMLAPLSQKLLSMDDFIEESKKAKLFVRTSELKPASNIMLVSASGCAEICNQYDVSFDLSHI